MDCNRARSHDPGEWLELCPDFSRPLAEQLVEWILLWQPDLTESIKWNNLCFSGRKLICGLSACQKHLGIVFFRGTELPDPHKLFDETGANNTNIRTIRVTDLKDFNTTAFRKLLHAAVELDNDPAIPPAPKMKRKPLPVPACLKAALQQPKHKAAAENFKKLSPSCQREYIVWVGTAKRPETQSKRLAETLVALTNGRKWIDRKTVQAMSSAR